MGIPRDRGCLAWNTRQHDRHDGVVVAEIGRTRVQIKGHADLRRQWDIPANLLFISSIRCVFYYDRLKISKHFPELGHAAGKLAGGAGRRLTKGNILLQSSPGGSFYPLSR